MPVNLRNPVAADTVPIRLPGAVDSHAHIFLRSLRMAPVRRHTPEQDAPLKDYLAQLDAHGITHGVLVQPSFLGCDNRFLLDALKRHPQRLRGVVVVEPEAGAGSLRAMAAQGVVGIRLNLVGQAIPDFSAPPWLRLLAQVRELGWHVEVQRQAGDLPAILPPLLDSGCKLVVDHFGRPDAAIGLRDPGFWALLSAANSGRVWVKLAAAYRSWGGPGWCAAGNEAAQALLAAFGSQRLLWGSDWPHTQHRQVADYASSLGALQAWVTDEVQRRAVLVDTPAALFKFNSGV